VKIVLIHCFHESGEFLDLFRTITFPRKTLHIKKLPLLLLLLLSSSLVVEVILERKSIRSSSSSNGGIG
jgi:hypothetical protein